MSSLFKLAREKIGSAKKIIFWMQDQGVVTGAGSCAGGAGGRGRDEVGGIYMDRGKLS